MGNRNITILAGSSHPRLAESICKLLELPVGRCKLGHFSNKETSVQILESVRDMDVYIVQSSKDFF
jgi:ribose-phosphate pyrophosphokinase